MGKLSSEFYKAAGFGKKVITTGGAMAMSTPSRTKHKIKGFISDTRRGHVLYKQGYGGRKSAWNITKSDK